MDVAILGATGDVGRQLCTQLIERRVVPTTSRMQLVGRPDGASGRACVGLRADLVDAYDEVAPWLDVALDASDVVADVVVVCAGRTVPTAAGSTASREELAEANAAVFRSYAQSLAEHGSGQEVVIVVSNPVELGVAIFASELGRHRVIGMGAWLDTLRFRREVAVSTGVRRQRVAGFVAGQHGEDLVPLWSSVRVHGMAEPESRAALAALRGERSLDDFAAEVADAKQAVGLATTRSMSEAFRLIETMPPDLRTVARPWLTHQSGAKTAAGTASATVDLVDTVLDGRDIVVAGQVALDGEVVLAGEPVRGVLGVPVVVGAQGWSEVLLGALAPDEERRLAGAAERIQAVMREWVRA